MPKRRRLRIEREYQLPPVLMAVWRHPRTRVIHFRNECRAMKYGRDHMTPLLVRADTDELANLPGEACRFCFGS
jgi:hypothetical protein